MTKEELILALQREPTLKIATELIRRCAQFLNISLEEMITIIENKT